MLQGEKSRREQRLSRCGEKEMNRRGRVKGDQEAKGGNKDKKRAGEAMREKWKWKGKTEEDRAVMWK